MVDTGIALANPMLQESRPRNGGRVVKVLALFALALFGCSVLSGWSSTAGHGLSAPEPINTAALPSIQTVKSLPVFRPMSPTQQRFLPGTYGRISEVHQRAPAVHAQYSPEQLEFLKRKEEAKAARMGQTGGSPPMAEISDQYGGGYTQDQLEFMKRKEEDKRERISKHGGEGKAPRRSGGGGSSSSYGWGSAPAATQAGIFKDFAPSFTKDGAWTR